MLQSDKGIIGFFQTYRGCRAMTREDKHIIGQHKQLFPDGFDDGSMASGREIGTSDALFKQGVTAD